MYLFLSFFFHLFSSYFINLSADGHYEVTLMTKAKLHFDGKLIWNPPAIFKSSCTINVEFFPFDEQQCSMKFGSRSYDGLALDLVHINQSKNNPNVIPVGIDLENFYQNIEWDILAVPAKRSEIYNPCCVEPFIDLTFNVKIRRKTLFYTVNLIIPCISISFLTVLTFYLPSDSRQKISLSVNILLSLTIFFLLLSDLMPATSLVVPLMCKYLIFTMNLVTLSLFITACVLNVHYHSFPIRPWIRRLFINTIPKILLIKKSRLETLTEFSKECELDINVLKRYLIAKNLCSESNFEMKSRLASRSLSKEIRNGIRNVVEVCQYIKQENYIKMVL